MNKKPIIFDFDGVIVDSMQMSFSINKQLIPDLEYPEWQSWSEGNIFTTIRPENKTESHNKLYFERYGEGVVNLLPVEGMADIIRELAERYELVIVSSSTQDPINAFLGKYDLRKYFADVLGVETHKSKAEKFRLVFEKYQISPSETLIVTDTIGDIKEARNIGMKALAVIWGVHGEDKMREVNPHFIATKPSEIVTGIEAVLR